MEILQALKEQRDQIDNAIQILQGDTKKRTRKARGRRGRPPATRKRLSAIMRKRWIAARKAGRNRL